MTNICSVISNVLCSLAAKVTNPPIGQKREKIGTKEMHERNRRCLSIYMSACCLHVSELSVCLSQVLQQIARSEGTETSTATSTGVCQEQRESKAIQSGDLAVIQ